MTCGQILADNIKQCAEIVEQADPGKPTVDLERHVRPVPQRPARKAGCTWPRATARGTARGKGCRRASSSANWHNNNADSLKFFADRGNAQILAGFYDADPERIVEWLRDGRQGPRTSAA